MDGDFEVGRPPGHPTGVPINVPVALNLSGLPLIADTRYEWGAFIDGNTDDDWRAGFCTRQAPPRAARRLTPIHL